MTATSAILEKTKPATPKPIGKKPAYILWEELQCKYLSREDKFKYEWVTGMVEKTERTMNQYQTFIAANLLDFFFQAEICKKGIRPVKQRNRYAIP